MYCSRWVKYTTCCGVWLTHSWLDFLLLQRCSDITDAVLSTSQHPQHRLQRLVSPTTLSALSPQDSRMGVAEADSQLVYTLAIITARPSKHLSLSPSFQRCALGSWVRENIRKKECCFFERGVR